MSTLHTPQALYTIIYAHAVAAAGSVEDFSLKVLYQKSSGTSQLLLLKVCVFSAAISYFQDLTLNRPFSLQGNFHSLYALGVSTMYMRLPHESCKLLVKEPGKSFFNLDTHVL
jgi:hypothetical protein